jgi:spermidine synthase
MGDARLKLRDAPDSHYGLIVLDAFSGDSIPMHLLTREALALYLRKLAPGGVIAFHISSLYLQLAPTLGNLCQDAHLACLAEDDTVVTPRESDEGKSASLWVVMARDQSNLTALAADKGSHAPWLPLQVRPGQSVWTDDYSNMLSAVKWTWGKH